MWSTSSAGAIDAHASGGAVGGRGGQLAGHRRGVEAQLGAGVGEAAPAAAAVVEAEALEAAGQRRVPR